MNSSLVAHTSGGRPRALRRGMAGTLLCIACGAFAPLANAQKDGQGDASRWAVGVGVLAEQELYRGTGSENNLVPLIRYENRYLLVQLPSVELKLPKLELGRSSSLDFRVVATYEDEGYKASDSAFLAGMTERKASLWAGAKVTWEVPFAELSAEWLGDASGNSKGRIFNLELETDFDVGSNVEIAPRVGLKMFDRKYADYYFGVRSGEASLARPTYAGRSGRNYELGVRATYSYGKQHMFIFDASTTGLSKAIKDSPLVDRSSQRAIFLGYLYRF